MYTQCPNCNTVFRISAQQLKAAAGRVRCGHCSHVFNALDKLLEHLPPGYTPGTPPPPPRKTQTPAAPLATPPAKRPAPPRATPSAGTSNAAPARPPVPRAPAAKPVTKPAPTPAQRPAASPVAAKPTPPAKTGGATTAPPVTAPAKTPAGEAADTGLPPPRPWAPKKPDKPTPATPPRRRVSDESKRTETPSFKDIQLPGGPIGMDSVDWSIPDDDRTPPDLDLSAAGAPKRPADKHGAGSLDEAEVEDIDAFLKELAADVAAVDAHLDETEGAPSPTETLLLVDEVAAPPPEEQTPAPPPSPPPAPSPKTNDSHEEHRQPAPSFDPLATIERAPVIDSTETDEESVPPSLRASLAAAEEKPRGPLATLLGVLLIVILLAGLAGQAAYFRGGAIATQVPAVRPWLDRFCGLARCTIPARRDLAKLALVSRDVRSDPKAKGALLISATIVNNASFAQPYPDLLVTLYDLTGTAVAQRQFKPAEYLVHTPQALTQYKAGRGMPADTPVNIELEVVDPGKQAINYEFDFR